MQEFPALIGSVIKQKNCAFSEISCTNVDIASATINVFPLSPIAIVYAKNILNFF